MRTEWISANVNIEGTKKKKNVSIEIHGDRLRTSTARMSTIKVQFDDMAKIDVSQLSPPECKIKAESSTRREVRHPSAGNEEECGAISIGNGYVSRSEGLSGRLGGGFVGARVSPASRAMGKTWGCMGVWGWFGGGLGWSVRFRCRQPCN